MRKTIFAIGLLVASILPVAVQAATVNPAYEKSAFINGVGIFSDTFTVPVAGTYQATLTDMAFPTAFDALFFAVSTSTGLEGGVSSSGSFTFDATPGITYFANIAGLTSGPLNLGLFGAEVALVPIPAAAMLFASAVISLLVVARRRGGNSESSATPA